MQRYLNQYPLTCRVYSSCWNVGQSQIPSKSLKEFLSSKLGKFQIYLIALEYDDSSSKGKEFDIVWTAFLVQTFDEDEYINIVHNYHTGLYSSVWVAKELAHDVSNIVIDRMDKSGFTLGIRMQIQETKLTFLNTILEEGPSKHGKRLEHISMVESHYRFGEGSPKLQPQGQSSSFVFWSGSFNSCLIGQKSLINEWLERQLFESNLLKLDQLYVSMKENKVLKNFVEYPISFAPTSPFEKDMKSYTRHEMPAYSDRVFVMGNDVEFEAYTYCSGYTNSDHKPVILAVKIALSDCKDYSGLQNEMIPIEMTRRPSWKRHTSIVMVSPVLPSTWVLSDFDWNPNEPVEERTFKSIHIPSKKDYFMHVIPKESSKDHINEFHLLTYIDCPFVQKCHRIFSDMDNVYCVLDPCHGAFASFLGKQRYGDEEAKFYISQVILAVKEMHSQNMVHGNINPNSIRMRENGFVKLCCYRSGGLMTNGDYLDPYTAITATNQKPVDFYAIGILAFQLMCGTVDKTFDASRMHISSKARDFIAKLLMKDPNSRLGSKSGCEELIKHPWLAGFNWKAISSLEIPPPFVPVSPSQRRQVAVGETIRSFKNRRSLDSSKSPNSSSAMTRTTSCRKFSRDESDNVNPRLSRDSLDSVGSVFDEEMYRKQSLGSDPNGMSGYCFGSNLSRVSTDSIISDTTTVFLSGEDIKKEAKRLEVIAEILSTEEIYVKSLKIVIHHFYNPLLKILSNQVHQAIFQSFISIVGINGAFLTQLEATINTHTEFDAIVDVLHRNTEAFKLYSDYTSNYVTAFETMEKEKKKNTKFAKFLIKSSEELIKANQMGDLLSYLVLPMQRLPRYKMMFEELLKATPKHEQAQLQKTVDEITIAVGLCNEKTKENEMRRQIVTLQQKYCLPIKPQTILIQKAVNETIKVIYNSKKTEIIPEHLIAFNDLIIFQYKDKFRLTKCVKFPIEKYIVAKVVSNNPVKAIGIVQGKESLVFLFEYDYTWQKWSSVFPISTDTLNSIFI